VSALRALAVLRLTPICAADQASRWSAFLTKTLLGPERARYHELAEIYRNGIVDRPLWEAAAREIGLKEVGLAYAAEAPISPGRQLFMLATTLYDLGNPAENEPPGSNAEAWQRQISPLAIRRQPLWSRTPAFKATNPTKSSPFNPRKNQKGNIWTCWTSFSTASFRLVGFRSSIRLLASNAVALSKTCCLIPKRVSPIWSWRWPVLYTISGCSVVILSTPSICSIFVPEPYFG